MMFISKLSGIILPSEVYKAFIEKEYMQGESISFLNIHHYY